MLVLRCLKIFPPQYMVHDSFLIFTRTNIISNDGMGLTQVNQLGQHETCYKDVELTCKLAAYSAHPPSGTRPTLRPLREENNLIYAGGWSLSITVWVIIFQIQCLMIPPRPRRPQDDKPERNHNY